MTGLAVVVTCPACPSVFTGRVGHLTGFGALLAAHEHDLAGATTELWSTADPPAPPVDTPTTKPLRLDP